MLKHFFLLMVTYDQQNLDTTSLIICFPFNQPLICHKVTSRFCPELSQNATCKHFHSFIQVYFQQLQRPGTDYPLVPRGRHCTTTQSASQAQSGVRLPARPAPALPASVNPLLWSLPLKYAYTSLCPWRPSDSHQQLTRTTFILTARPASNLNSSEPIWLHSTARVILLECRDANYLLIVNKN